MTVSKSIYVKRAKILQYFSKNMENHSPEQWSMKFDLWENINLTGGKKTTSPTVWILVLENDQPEFQSIFDLVSCCVAGMRNIITCSLNHFIVLFNSILSISLYLYLNLNQRMHTFWIYLHSASIFFISFSVYLLIKSMFLYCDIQQYSSNLSIQSTRNRKSNLVNSRCTTHSVMNFNEFFKIPAHTQHMGGGKAGDILQTHSIQFCQIRYSIKKTVRHRYWNHHHKVISPSIFFAKLTDAVSDEFRPPILTDLRL